MSYDPRQWLNYGEYYNQDQNEEDKSSQQKSNYNYSPAENSYVAPNFYETESSNVISSKPNQKRNIDEYDPTCPSFNAKPVQTPPQPKSIPDPRKLDAFISKLQKMIRPLP